MSTIEKVNFEPVSDILATQRKDFALADRTLAVALNANALVDGEWFTINSSYQAQRAVAINAAGNVATLISYPVWSERGRTDVLAQAGRKVPLIWLGEYEFDTRIFDATSTAGGANFATVGVGGPLKVASIDIGGKIVSGLVGATSAPYVGIITRLPANNGGKLRFRSFRSL